MSGKLTERKKQKLEDLLLKAKTIEILRAVKEEDRIISGIQEEVGGSYETLYKRIRNLIDRDLVNAETSRDIGRVDSPVISLTETGKKLIDEWEEMLEIVT